jgi:RHS repeat-associated protein
LPDTVQFKTGNQIVNRYTAGGQKIRTEYFTQVTNITPLTEGTVIPQSYTYGVVDQTGSAYVDHVEYKTNNGSSLARCREYNPEGYATGLGYLNYYRKDHLGNNREVWQAAYTGVTASTIQRISYYPSGLPWAESTGIGAGVQSQKYNGKEFVEMHGYDTYDYGARGLYPAIGRFTSVDILAEMYYSISPYAYCLNNPIRYVDPNGMWPTRKVVDNGRIGSRFGPRIHPVTGRSTTHKGQDFPAPIGSNVHAAAEGIVTNVNYQFNPKKGTGWGYYVEITHPDGTVTKYSHLQQGGVNIKIGQSIVDGQIIALSGATGGVTGPHLDLEIIQNGAPVDPLSITNLQDRFNNHGEFDNEEKPVELDAVVVTAKNPNPPKTLEQRLEDMNWSSVRQNENGNTGRYNQQGRTTDQFYSDDFLKMYYNK